MSINWHGQRGPLTWYEKEGVFKDADRQEFTFRGVNWSGFELERGMLDGLNKGYQGNDLETGLVRDNKVVATRMKLLGFNTIRLPFSFAVCCIA